MDDLTTVCTRCRVSFAKSRPTCPRCNQANKVASHVPTRQLVWIGALVLVLILFVAGAISFGSMLGLGIAIFVVGGFLEMLSTPDKEKVILAKLGELPEFKVSQHVLSSDRRFGLAIDEKRLKLCLIDCQYEIPEIRVVTHRDIVSAEVVEDGESIVRTDRVSQLGSALVGGLAFGGVGAAVGALTGKTRSTSEVQRLELRITVDDMTKPNHDVAFISSPTKKSGAVNEAYYRNAVDKSRHWHGLIEILIRRANQEAQPSAPAPAPITTAPRSFADELGKLVELRDSGALTEQEFSAQKAKLLNS